ncbi:site-specific DNA-methyltransferase [Methylosarcina fibrata]|uniref:site-specific DNA-methyltransferase n=1 Tax=Methylosarcina fibrata TaxID=105972 RepID=UPI0018DED95A|nr:site-specific DNA-methyltransferase [Methylosarcina fibrata]
MKALLPRYAGKVDCIFIDPPYNTGNENWCYNDNVNSPIMREWLNSNPVNREDMLRHDKWLALMWPRLKLLHELLAETGSFWMTLDDNEVHRARMMLDEIFGEENFVAAISWQNKVSPANDAKYFSDDFDFILVYAANKSAWLPNGLERTEDQEAYYSNPDNDPRGVWNSATYTCNKSRLERPSLYYPITNPFTGEKVLPSESAVWRFSKEKHLQLEEQGALYWGANGTAKMPRLKRFLEDMGSIVPRTVWNYSEVGHTQGAMTELKNILGFTPFQTPKPVSLLQRILQIATTDNSVVLDSFAGSATTAHAVLAQNAKDGGNRKFILVECEDYADSLTAERVRRVINGYEFQGTQKEELYREKITWSNFSRDKAHQKILHQVEGIENLDGLRFDTIKKEIKDGELTVTGEKKITEKVAGLGGGFTFYTLGEPIDINHILTGESLPDYQALGAWLFHTATGQPLPAGQTDAGRWYVGESAQYHVWLIYRPELDFLKSREAALTLSLAERIGASHADKRHLVFAPVKFVPNKTLLPLGVEYAPLPFALYRIEKD